MALADNISTTLDAEALFSGNHNTKITKQRWDAILQCKKEFLENHLHDPSQNSFMDQEVAASWIRSKKKGVNPQKVVTLSCPHRLTELKKQHDLLIKTTHSILNPIKQQMVESGYLFYLFDKSGLILLHEGIWTENQLIAATGTRVGLVVNEGTQGTMAHELCFRHKRPIQLLGPENYNFHLQNRIASATPIMRDGDDVPAALVILSPPLVDPASDETINHLYMHTLGLISSIAVSIESQLKLHTAKESCNEAENSITKLNKELELAKGTMSRAHKTLTASFAFIDEGMVAVDSTGKILNINNEAIRIFKVHPQEIGNRNISEFLSQDSTIMAKARKGIDFTVDECVKGATKKPCAYRINGQPVQNQITKKLDAVILKFVDCTKQRNSRAGRTASYKFESILGQSPQVKTAISQAKRFSDSPENILLFGESGVGKELFAQSIHNNHRPKGPFMAVNCAALPRELIGSELFGYEGGSFTGAERCGKPGKIELAHEGTLFLDEIGDMPLEQQAILLRTLQDKKVMRVGGHSYKEIDFRLLAATNKDLAKMVEEKTFREDLFYRISVLTVYIPSLRERTQDVSYLSRVFIENYCRRYDWEIPELSAEAEQRLNSFHWPGNVRQLQNAIHHAITMSTNKKIEEHHLPQYVVASRPPKTVELLTNSYGFDNDSLSIKQIEKEVIEAALKRSDNCIPSAAELVGLSRSTLYRKLKEHNIDID